MIDLLFGSVLMVPQTGIAFLDGGSPGLFVRFAIDLFFVTVLVGGIYYRHYGRADLFLTLFSFNLSIFLITYLMNQVEMTIGAAFGLFAVFSMLRYRTDTISAKDMTYIFLVIALGLIMSVSQMSWLGLIAVGGTLILVVHLLEASWLIRREQVQRVLYENIDLVNADHRAELIADLQARTGLKVHRVDVNEIDFMRDAAKLTVYYYE
jgi:hypothetical protein